MKKLLLIAILFGILTGCDSGEQSTRVRVKKVIVHDTVYVDKQVSVNQESCGSRLVDQFVFEKHKIKLNEIPAGAKYDKNMFAVGVPFTTKEKINEGIAIGLGVLGTTFDDVQYYSVGCNGNIFDTPNKPGHISCSGEWVILIKEGL